MSKTLLQALMDYNNLGVSGNSRNIHYGIVWVDGKIITDKDFLVEPGQVILIGRHQSFTV